ncbi:uncharacterized protein LOC115885048 [Sitophilus oryzae]|uniref:Uncharacterized protein LOC115885048 n=1 Tax=Sitophilus oryzae TaxID=7048 RepID=A0A6J2Y912_SITOR|nr:uncharacterized protein LOC115885048 [Sitophilus oryzae]
MHICGHLYSHLLNYWHKSKWVVFMIICFVQEIYTYNVTNWKYHFPEESGMGLYAAVAWPLTDINIDVFGAVFFEAYYSLPDNQTTYEYPPVIAVRSFGRKLVYDTLETKLNSKGYPGKACLLRSICEAASYSMQHLNGVLGDLFHILLTPSTTNDTNEDYFSEYWEAEETGSKTQNCEQYNSCHVLLVMCKLQSSLRYLPLLLAFSYPP